MKQWLTKKNLVIFGILSIFVSIILYLFLDAFYISNFRMTTDKISSVHAIDLRGLGELQASGGNLVRFSDLREKLSSIKTRKIIVDGMAEFHGYINGIPTTFLAYQRKTPELKHLIRRWIFTGTSRIQAGLVQTEEEEAKKHGFEYKKVNIGSAYTETNENIDHIIDFFDSLTSDVWLHFHCARGKGRTSILLTMWDIFKNAPHVPLKDIIQRQHLLGSENLFDTSAWKKGTYNKTMLEDRKKFIEDFYQFISQRKRGGIQQWSEWRANHE